MAINLNILIIAFSLGSMTFSGGCKKKDVFDDDTQVFMVDIGTISLQVYQKGKGQPAVLFENGLADFANVWNEADVFDQVANFTRVIAYNRAGYPASEMGELPRTAQQINKETLALMNAMDLQEVILVGHSLGGMYIRSFAIANPSRVAALLFVDPSHEDYRTPNDPGPQAAIDYFKNTYGENDIRYLEALQLPAVFNHIDTLPSLPDIPVIVITSTMKSDQMDSLNRYQAHDQLGSGISDFTHSSTDKAGHYIMIDQPEMVIESIRNLWEAGR